MHKTYSNDFFHQSAVKKDLASVSLNFFYCVQFPESDFPDKNWGKKIRFLCQFLVNSTFSHNAVSTILSYFAKIISTMCNFPGLIFVVLEFINIDVNFSVKFLVNFSFNFAM